MSKRKRTSSSPSVPTGNDDSHSSEEEEQSRRPPPPHLASLAAPQLPQFRLPPRPPPPRSALHPPPPPRPPVSQPLPRPPPKRRLPPPPPRLPAPSTVTQQNQSQPLNLPQPQQHQPPVYNINKSDFHDVIQKLTGSPAHERFSTPPPIQPPKLTSSLLQKIQPPPLPQLSARPPPLLSCVPISTASGGFVRQVQQLSPLPPFPAVHTAAESPISAYRRYLQSSNSNTDSDSKRFAGFSPLAPLVSPRWNNFAQPLPTQPQNVPHSPTAASSRRPPPQIQHPLIHYLERQNPVLKVRMPPPPTEDSNPDIRPTTLSQPSQAQQRALAQATLAAIANILEVDGPADQVPPSSSSVSLHGPSTQARYPTPRPPPPDIIDLSPAKFLGDENDPVIPQFQHPRPQAPAGPAKAAPRPAGPLPNKSPEIAPPYPWAGTRRATVRTLEYLISNGINLISGQSRCNICNKIYIMDLDLTQKFKEVSDIVRNQARRHMSWIDNPRYPDCPSCKSKNCLVPVINNAVKKRNVNWLFLLLGQWIACCRNTPQLTYFLKHNGIDYPNATSDLQLYLTFLAICKQLRPGDKLFDPY